MKSKRVLLVCGLLLTTAFALTQTGTNPDERMPAPGRIHAAQRPKPEAAPAQPAPAADQQEVEALRADIARMKVLLNQMRTNLAFVQSTESPLKHEFDLNNDMWQMLLNDMERRLQKIEAPSRAPKP